MKQIKIALSDSEYDALLAWSSNQLREPSGQAHFFIQQGLKKRYQHANISASDIQILLYWLEKIPLAEPIHVADAVKRLRLCVNEHPKESNIS